MIILLIAIFVVVIVTLAIQEATNSKQKKLINLQQIEIARLKKVRADNLAKLEQYVTQNPIDAYKLLVDHVDPNTEFGYNIKQINKGSYIYVK